MGPPRAQGRPRRPSRPPRPAERRRSWQSSSCASAPSPSEASCRSWRQQMVLRRWQLLLRRGRLRRLQGRRLLRQQRGLQWKQQALRQGPPAALPARGPAAAEPQRLRRQSAKGPLGSLLPPLLPPLAVLPQLGAARAGVGLRAQRALRADPLAAAGQRPGLAPPEPPAEVPAGATGDGSSEAWQSRPSHTEWLDSSLVLAGETADSIIYRRQHHRARLSWRRLRSGKRLVRAGGANESYSLICHSAEGVVVRLVGARHRPAAGRLCAKRVLGGLCGEARREPGGSCSSASLRRNTIAKQRYALADCIF